VSSAAFFPTEFDCYFTNLSTFPPSANAFSIVSSAFSACGLLLALSYDLLIEDFKNGKPSTMH
jgi:hypothetical protein